MAAKEYTMQPDLDSWINRVMHRSAYKKAVRFYLDYRKKHPGKAQENAWKVAQITGADYRNLEKIIHDMIKKGKLPKHLAWDKKLVESVWREVVGSHSVEMMTFSEFISKNSEE